MSPAPPKRSHRLRGAQTKIMLAQTKHKRCTLFLTPNLQWGRVTMSPAPLIDGGMHKQKYCQHKRA